MSNVASKHNGRWRLRNLPRALRRAAAALFFRRTVPERHKLPRTPWKIWVVNILIFAVVMGGCAVSFLLPESMRPATGLMLAMIYIVIWVAGYIWHEALEEILLLARGHRWLLCTRCYSPLNECAPEGHCPKCGTAYSHAELPRLWKRWLTLSARGRIKGWRDYLRRLAPRGSRWEKALDPSIPRSPASVRVLKLVGLAGFLAIILLPGPLAAACGPGAPTALMLRLPLLVVGVGFAVGIGAWVACVVATERFRKRMTQVNWQICTRCHYPLADLPERGCCPECGCSYSREELPLRWQLWMKYRMNWMFRPRNLKV